MPPRPWISFDVETSGELPEYALQPHRVRQGKAWLTTLAVSQRVDGEIRSKGKIVYGLSKDEVRSILVTILTNARDTKSRLLGWNIVFDCGWVLAYELEQLVLECEWIDGMLMWKHLDIEPTFVDGAKNKRSYGLKRWVDTHTNRGGYEHGVDYHDMSPANLGRLKGYNVEDTVHTLYAAEGFWSKLDARRRSCVITEASCIPLMAGANLNGMPIHDDNVQALDAKLDLARATLHAKLAKLGVTEDMVRSPAKLSTLLFKKWGLPVIKLNEPTAAAKKKAEAKGETAVGTPSTDKEVLYELALDHPNVELLGKWRESMNLRGKFVAKIKASVEYNGDGNITRPQGIIFGTYTSRCTYNSKQGRGQSERQTGFALHQMKRGEDFRNMVVAPEDHDIVEFDAAGQEFRWMAVESGDVTMLSLCAPGEDPHSFMASQIGKRDYRELIRLVKAAEKAASNARKGGKVANLSLQYRTSKKKLRIVSRVQYGIPMTEDEALHVHTTYRKSYPGVPIYWKRQIQLAKSQGYIENLAGRRVRIEGDWTGENAYSMEQTSINYPIQGVGGEQKYLALRVLKNHLAHYGARFAWDLHDGLYFYVPKANSMRFAIEMQKVLDNLPYRQAWGFMSPIPLPWDAKIGPSWGSLVEIAA